MPHKEKCDYFGPMNKVKCECGHYQFQARPKTGIARLYCKKCNNILPGVIMDENNNLINEEDFNKYR